MATVYPEEFWSSGFASRLIMIYHDKPAPITLFPAEYLSDQQEAARDKILGKLARLSQLFGPMRWHVDAAEHLNAWHLAGGPPTPRHSKLAHYNTRRTNQHVPKLAMISALARTARRDIELIDVERAIAWITEAEHFMPDIFKAMVGKSDGQLIEELFYHISSIWHSKKKPVHKSHVWQFLASRAPGPAIPRILEVAVNSGVLRTDDLGETYLPRPRDDHMLEE